MIEPRPRTASAGADATSRTACLLEHHDIAPCIDKIPGSRQARGTCTHDHDISNIFIFIHVIHVARGHGTRRTNRSLIGRAESLEFPG